MEIWNRKLKLGGCSFKIKKNTACCSQASSLLIALLTNCKASGTA